MTIYETCGSSTIGYSANIYVKYVRRELRSLTTDDREEFLDTLKILYDVNTIDGQKLYGSNYKSLYYFLSIHVDAAGNPVCDEFHSGAGFLSNHVFLSNYLEQSLQAVNPKTALHYMEYVNDFSSISYQSHLDNQLDGGSWTELFSSTYFGENDPYSGRIINGRWKDTIVPYMTDSFLDQNLINKDKTFFPNEEVLWLTMSSAHLKSPFGLLRPPWNYNPSPYIGRYNNEAGISVVTNNNISDFFIGTQCSDVKEFLTEFVINKNLDSYLLNVKNYHTKVHDGIGGQGGENARSIDNYLINNYNLTNDDIIVIIQSSSKFYKKYLPLKYYYTSTKYPIYPLVCSENPWDESTESLSNVDFPSCQCNDYYYQSDDNLNTLIKIYFDKFAFESTIQYNSIKKIMALDYTNKLNVMKKLCSRLGYDGDMVGSASAIDPIFWVSHGSVEKLYQKLIINDLFLDLQYTASSSSCSGHAPWGKKDWLNGYKFINTDIEVNEYTNAQLSDVLNPNSILYRDLISYVYDNAKSNCEDVEELLSN
uniref:Tyrosinase copper-binding domain-containing protein n=1 Tax=Chromulina nebulosa TaxID=96789 RepID=A0A7S0XFD2_9STRA|mmetsp:Transcript_687/g.597  ORF Transcript_687/g.597 Transcript_687/m.597 type:complete len:536 (+) Transcript_687:328-1935(+)